MEVARVACLAPPLTDEKLVEYQSLVSSVEKGTELRDVLDILLNCVTRWWEARESTHKAVEVATGTDITVGPMVRFQKLDSALVSEFWDSVPWLRELVAFGAVLDTITDKPLRDCGFHMLWYATELCNDREPLSSDRIVA